MMSGPPDKAQAVQQLALHPLLSSERPAWRQLCSRAAPCWLPWVAAETGKAVKLLVLIYSILTAYYTASSPLLIDEASSAAAYDFRSSEKVSQQELRFLSVDLRVVELDEPRALLSLAVPSVVEQCVVGAR